MNWAQCLKRAFAIEIEQCERCGARVRIIAAIEDQHAIQKILSHLGLARTHLAHCPGDLHKLRDCSTDDCPQTALPKRHSASGSSSRRG